MTAIHLDPIERTDPDFRDLLDALFLTEMPAAFEAFNAEIDRINAFAFGSYSATSTTSLTIGSGSKTLTVEPGKGFTEGQPVLITNSAMPSNYMNGRVTSYDSTTGAMTVNVTDTAGGGTAATWSVSISAVVMVTGSPIKQRTVAGAGALTVSDFGKLINLNGTFTLTPDAAATLGAGWWCWLRNVGTGTPTLDPTGAETVDGVASGAVRGTVLLICDGAGFTAIKQGPFTTTEVLTSGTSWTAPLGVRNARVRGEGGAGSAGGGGLAFGGGGGGGFDVRFLTSPGTTHACAIGAQGAPVSAPSTGNTGGSTTFTANGITYTALGGGGGTGSAGGSGGGSSGAGALLLRGSNGWSSAASSPVTGNGALNYNFGSGGCIVLEY